MPSREALEMLLLSSLMGGVDGRVPPREALERLPPIKFDRGRVEQAGASQGGP